MLTLLSPRYLAGAHGILGRFVVWRDNRGTELVDVVMAACRTETVDSRVAVVELAGLSMEKVDVEAFATARAAELLPVVRNAPADTVSAIFDIGANTTSMVVIREGRVVYTREHAFGGRSLVGHALAPGAGAVVEPRHLAGLAPIDDVRATAAYRMDAARTLVARAIERCIARTGAGNRERAA